MLFLCVFMSLLLSVCFCRLSAYRPCFLNYKKFQLMLTRRAKAYSSSCSQTVSLSPAISSQFILSVYAAAEDRKNQ